MGNEPGQPAGNQPSVVACPAGTTQIGGAGARTSTYDYGRMQYYEEPNTGLTVENCKLRCQYNSNCRAFTYDDDQYGGSNPMARCSLYAVNQQMQPNADYGVMYGETHPNADQLLCGLDSRANAESPGLFSLDGFDGNGETIQLSVYLIYFVIGLVLVNIICLCMYYWNKCTKGSNKRKYKVVSMRSDTDTDIENL